LDGFLVECKRKGIYGLKKDDERRGGLFFLLSMDYGEYNLFLTET
jgi:hypothetical protein